MRPIVHDQTDMTDDVWFIAEETDVDSYLWILKRQGTCFRVIAARDFNFWEVYLFMLRPSDYAYRSLGKAEFGFGEDHNAWLEWAEAQIYSPLQLLVEELSS